MLTRARVEIGRRLVDGNNSPSGAGVIFDGDEALGVVEDVVAILMGNGCFSDYRGSDGVYSDECAAGRTSARIRGEGCRCRTR